MFEGKSERDVLRIWLRAAEEFAQSAAPHVAKFAVISGHAAWSVLRGDDLSDMTRVVEEIAGARAASNPGKVDAVLLRSGAVTMRLGTVTEDLLQSCVNLGILTSPEERTARADAIDNAVKRRRRSMGLKGRYFLAD